MTKMQTEDLLTRLRKRAEIRRQIPSRKSVQNNEPDRIADLLEEAADEIQKLKLEVKLAWEENSKANWILEGLRK